MMEVGRLCIKIAGRDAGKKCVIVDVLDDLFVMIDGETRRRKCNMKHIEPTSEMIKISKGAAHSDVVAEFKNLGIEIVETKPRQAKPRQKQIRAADRKKMAVKAELKKTSAVKKDDKPVTDKPELKKEVDSKEQVETKLEKAISEEKSE